jgi:PKD repeat protein
MSNNNFYLLLILIILFSLTNCPLALNENTAFKAGTTVAQFRVLPGLKVEVGEEVFFDATNGAYSVFPQTNTNRYEWDFGDGYTMKWYSPQSSDRFSGICTTHFFIKPGTFTVTLTVTGTKNEISTATKELVVSGNPRTGKLDLSYADFHGHIAQYIYAKLADTTLASARLEVVVTGDNGYQTTVYTGLLSQGREEEFLLRNSALPMGNYTFRARLFSGNDIIDEIKEKFAKPYNGIPHVGINENNAICLDGTPFFPVTPWLLDNDKVDTWLKPAPHINTLLGEGWYKEHTINSWTDYCTKAYSRGLRAIGPDRWEGKGSGNTPVNGVKYTRRNSDPNKIIDYIQATKSNPGLFMWMWGDEPNLGGRDQNIPGQVARAWTYLCHQYDPQHLVATNLYGYDFMPYYTNPSPSYLYNKNAVYFGGRKTPVFDVLDFDIYPLEYYWHASFNGPNDNTHDMEDYIKAIDAVINEHHNLIPSLSFLEVCDVLFDGSAAYPAQPGPTPDQLRFEIWINIIHGIKGISWFPYFGFNPATAETFPVMEAFTTRITELAPIVLGPEPARTVTDTANTRHNRVDVMIRETATDIWLFAARVTELSTTPAPLAGSTPEASSIDVEFTIAGYGSGTATVIDEGNRKVTVSGGKFTDAFGQYAVHIYKIPK